MELQQLRYFLATVDAGSFSRGAARCGVAQPSLSQQILKLEREIGQPLFDRLGRSIALTPAGTSLLPRARRILAETASAQSEIMSEVAAGMGRLTIGAIPTIAPYLLPPALGRLARSFPQAELVVREALTAQLLEAVATAEIDVCLCSLPIDDPQLVYEEVLVEPLLVAMARRHRLARKTCVTLDELEREPAVILEELHCLGQQVQAFCRRRNLRLKVVCRSTQLRTLLSLVATGIGISLVPRLSVEDGRRLGCVVRALADGQPSRPIVLVWHRDRARSILAKTFRELVRAQADEASKRSTVPPLRTDRSSRASVARRRERRRA